MTQAKGQGALSKEESPAFCPRKQHGQAEEMLAQALPLWKVCTPHSGQDWSWCLGEKGKGRQGRRACHPMADWRVCAPEGSLQSLGAGAFSRKLAFEAGQDWLCRGTWEMAAVACDIASTWHRQTAPCTLAPSGLNPGWGWTSADSRPHGARIIPKRMFLWLCAVACSLITYDRSSLTPSVTSHLSFLVAYLHGDYLRALCE